MREFYEDTWESLPADLHPPDVDVRRAFLLDRVKPGDAVLDLGSGEGDFAAAALAAGARPIAVDVAQRALDRARAKHPELSDLRLTPPHGPFPLKDGEADLVWASEVIEHVADTARWLSEVRRVLRPGGRLLLTTPLHGRITGVRIALAGFPPDFDPRGEHLRFYTRASLREVLEDFDFGDVRIRAAAGPPLRRRLLLAEASR
jgi:ubiquinone/menaquinone biosynthesis C-methylase UbiE